MSDDYKKIKIECYGTVIRGNEDTSEDQLAAVYDNEFGLLLADRFNAYDANQERIKELEAEVKKGLTYGAAGKMQARIVELKVALRDLIEVAQEFGGWEDFPSNSIDEAIETFNNGNKT